MTPPLAYIRTEAESISKELFASSPVEIGSAFTRAYACEVQRLYSMFPAGAPGVALLVQRGCIAAALASIISPTGWQHAVFFILLIMLCIGLFTPVVCALAAIVALLNLPHLRAGNSAELVIVLLAAISYAFLGPGAYSIDSRLFGRRMLVSTDSHLPKRDDQA